MTAPSRYRGQPVSEGIGTGEIYLGDAPGIRVGTAPVRPDPDEDDVRAAFAAVARERAALAARLRERGQDLQAGIVDIGALIAADPALTGPAIDAVRAGADGIAAVAAAAEAQAAVLAALPDPDLAQRAGDVRQVAAAVVDHLRGTSAPPPPAGKFILVRREVDPADLIQLADSGRAGSGLAGAVSVAGGASSHAAIIARGLGLPMLAGADPAVLAAAAGHHAILDAAAGELIVDPDPQTELDRSEPPGPHRAGPAGPAGGQDGRRRAGHAAVQRRLGRGNPAGPVRRRGRRRPAAHRDRLHRRLRLAVAGRPPGPADPGPRPARGPAGGRPAARLLRRQDPAVSRPRRRTGAGRPAPRPGSARGPAQGDPAGGRRYPARRPGADGHVAGRGRPGPRRAREGGRRGRRRPARARHHGRGRLHRGGGGGVRPGRRLLLHRHQ